MERNSVASSVREPFLHEPEVFRPDAADGDPSKGANTRRRVSTNIFFRAAVLISAGIGGSAAGIWADIVTSSSDESMDLRRSNSSFNWLALMLNCWTSVLESEHLNSGCWMDASSSLVCLIDLN